MVYWSEYDNPASEDAIRGGRYAYWTYTTAEGFACVGADSLEELVAECEILNDLAEENYLEYGTFPHYISRVFTGSGKQVSVPWKKRA